MKLENQLELQALLSWEHFTARDKIDLSKYPPEVIAQIEWWLDIPSVVGIFDDNSSVTAVTIKGG